MSEHHPIGRIGSDPEAFEAFYREHLDAVQRFIARRTASPHDAADLTADVFLAAIAAAGRYRPERGSPIGWLFGIARHVVAEHARRGARNVNLLNRISGQALLDADSLATVEDRLAAHQDARALYRALSTLPEADRALIELIALDGLTVADAAQVLGVKPGTARVRLHRARRQLTTHPLVTALEVHS